MLQCVKNPVPVDCACLVCAVLFDASVSISHSNADSGSFQHGKVVGTVSECIAVFPGDGKAIQEKFHACGFAGTLLCDFPDSVSVIKIGVMIITEAAEFFDIGIRQHMYQEFVIGVSAGILPIEFRDVDHWNFFSHFDSEFGLGRRCAIIQDLSVGFKNCLDLAFAEKVYGFLSQKIWDCAEKKQFVVHVNVGSTAVYIAIEMKL